MDNNTRDNAAIRFNFVSELYQRGVEKEKQRVLNSLNEDEAHLHQNGDLHIHDLEGYGKIYNCCTPNLQSWLSSDTHFSNASLYGKIIGIFESLKSLITMLATNQTGGIGFSNFDQDIAKILYVSTIEFRRDTTAFLGECMREFIRWINTTYTRYCREPYYLTLNIGLDTSEWGREISRTLLQEFINSPSSYSRPNIVFKTRRSVNGSGAPNYDLFQLALHCTAQRMIPTYLLMDSVVNQNCAPDKLAIMGCRTRVYDNCNGETGSIGRGNIACVSVNLPRIALKTSNLDQFFMTLNMILNYAEKLLLKRAETMREQGDRYLHFVIDHHLWNTSDVSDMIMQGTLSIGFIGISECVEILTGYKPFENSQSQFFALQIVKHIRDTIDAYRDDTGLNFSVLGSPGEMLSGRFCSLDKERYPHSVQEKGFYTNSFHVNVDAGVSIYRKIELEAPFHMICNGGCITYIELEAAPLKNTLALEDCIEFAVQKGISYLGFNFPYDLCRQCGALGTFDNCPSCGSNDIKRLRRVSGYLEELSHFTKGKSAEANMRKANMYIDGEHPQPSKL